MLKTLLITNSHDGTSDLLVRALGPGKIFRLNYDLIKDYDIEISADDIQISSAVFSISQNETSKIVWRKAFSGVSDIDREFGAFETAEYKYLLREILNIHERAGRLVFNRSDADTRCGKLTQLRLAARFFQVPPTHLISRTTAYEAAENTIAKSLASVPFDNGDVMYTTDISSKTLADRHPWYSQTRIDADFDVTVVYVYGRMFAFRLPRRLFAGLDWRKNVFELANYWEPYELTEAATQGIATLMSQAQWPFGRLDFLLVGGNLVFLEINPNGQWAWLDPKQTNGLFATVQHCIDPDTPVPQAPLTCIS